MAEEARKKAERRAELEEEWADTDAITIGSKLDAAATKLHQEETARERIQRKKDAKEAKDRFEQQSKGAKIDTYLEERFENTKLHFEQEEMELKAERANKEAERQRKHDEKKAKKAEEKRKREAMEERRKARLAAKEAEGA